MSASRDNDASLSEGYIARPTESLDLGTGESPCLAGHSDHQDRDQGFSFGRI